MKAFLVPLMSLQNRLLLMTKHMVSELLILNKILFGKLYLKNKPELDSTES